MTVHSYGVSTECLVASGFERGLRCYVRATTPMLGRHRRVSLSR